MTTGLATRGVLRNHRGRQQLVYVFAQSLVATLSQTQINGLVGGSGVHSAVSQAAFSVEISGTGFCTAISQTQITGILEE